LAASIFTRSFSALGCGGLLPSADALIRKIESGKIVFRRRACYGDEPNQPEIVRGRCSLRITHTTLPIEKGGVYDRKVWIRRLGPWLIVTDNSSCGPFNVGFGGT
jgi:hypothetical protein